MSSSAQNVKYGHLHLVLFPRTELSTALDYIRQRSVALCDGTEQPTIYTTGFGCTRHGKFINESLNIKYVLQAVADRWVVTA